MAAGPRDGLRAALPLLRLTAGLLVLAVLLPLAALRWLWSRAPPAPPPGKSRRRR